MAKKIIRITAYIIIPVIGIYFILMFAFGGYGKRPVTLLLPKTKDSTLLFAHRGLSVYYPESSMEAMQGAKKQGFNGVEVDIEKDRNGELIVFHDKDCMRLLGIKGNIDTMSTEQLKAQPLIYREEKLSTSYMMTLKELLDNYGNDFIFYFDMKLTDFETADDIAKVIEEYDLEKNCIVANSDFPFIFYMEHNYPEITTVLEGFDAGKEWTYYLMPKHFKPDYFSGFSWNINSRHVAWLKRNDLLDARIVYGVGNDNFKTMLDYGFKNLIIDYDSSITGVGDLR